MRPWTGPRLAVLVNGLPASGKSTLSPALAAALDLPLLGKDAIKETVAEFVGTDHPAMAQREWNRRMSAAAAETMWTLLATCPHGAVLDSTFPRDIAPLVTAGLARAGVGRVVEVWCRVPPEVARARDLERIATGRRHAIHGAAASEGEWAGWVQRLVPLGRYPLATVDTTEPVDVEALANEVRRLAAG